MPRMVGPPLLMRLGLHGLALAAVGDGVDPQVVAHGVDGTEVVAAVGCDALPVAVEPSKLAALDLVDLDRRDAEVFAGLGY